MPRREPPIDEQWQRLQDEKFLEALTFEPEQVRELAVSNLIIRTLTQLVGRGLKKAIPIEATEAGELKVASTGVPVAQYEHTKVTFSDDNADTITFTQVCSFVDIWIWTKDVLVRQSYDGSTWGGWFTLPADSYYCINASSKAVEIKNAAAGENATYQIMGWY